MPDILIDWFAFSIKNLDEEFLVGNALLVHRKLEQLFDNAGIPLQTYSGGHGFTSGYMSFGGCRTYYGGKNMVYHIQIHGSGCRVIDDIHPLGIVGFIDEMLAFDCKVTRLDLAADDREGLLKVDIIEKKHRAGEWTGTARVMTPLCPRNAFGELVSGATFYIGSRKTDKFIRIYDKAAQTETNGHWVRCELELHDDYAADVAKMVSAYDKEGIADTYNRIVFDTIRFLIKRNDTVTRSKVCKWWSDFLGSVTVGLRLTHPPDTSLHRMLESFRYRSLGQLEVIKKTVGFTWVFDALSEWEKEKELSKRHKSIISEFNSSMFTEVKEKLTYDEARSYNQFFNGSEEHIEIL